MCATRRLRLHLEQVRAASATPERYSAPCKGGAYLQVEVLPRQLAVQPRSYGWAVFGQLEIVEPPGQQLSKGGPASLRAATRVNPEQAPKEELREPTRL